MPTYGSVAVANSFLKLSFSEKSFPNLMKLQRQMYFVASEYAKETFEDLFGEMFGVWKFGPALSSLHNKFSCFEGEPIKNLAPDAQGNLNIVKPYSDPVLQKILEKILHATKDLDGAQLSHITRTYSSAWFKGWNTKADYIEFESLELDYTYYNYLRLRLEDEDVIADRLKLRNKNVS